jgi:glycosyltransferase involved in cell wall biosynthesis
MEKVKIPLITVLLSTYNAESYIREAVESVLNQTFQDFEFIIFEDCSQDCTLEILKSYNDPRIKLIINEENQGLTKNLIQGMASARGEFIARMDADDICMPNRFERQLEYFRDHPDVSVLGSAVTFFKDDGTEVTCFQPEAHDEIMVALFLSFTLLHPSVMMRKTALDKYNLTYDPFFRYSQDHDLWTRAIRNIRVANVPEPLIWMRHHNEKISIRNKNQQEDLSNIIRKRQLDELQISYSEQELASFNIACGMLIDFKAEQLKDLESIYLKILNANQKYSLFEQNILQRSIAKTFRVICMMILCQRNLAGNAYWSSNIRKYDTITFRQRMALFYRTARCYIK